MLKCNISYEMLYFLDYVPFDESTREGKLKKSVHITMFIVR